MLSEGRADDATQAPALLGQAKGSIARVTADGAYDGEPICRAVSARQPAPPPEVVILPGASIVLSTDDLNRQTPRNRHIRLVAEKGRMGWQRATGYGRRNRVETTIDRPKHRIGPKLCARYPLSKARRSSPSRCSSA